MDILIKASGDVIDKEGFYDWLSSIASPSNRLFILCGGGTIITDALREKGIEYEFLPTGREIKEERGRLLAKELLEIQGASVEKRLQERGIEAIVFVPVKELGDKVCHMNGDAHATALYPSFDKIFIVTLKGRTKVFSDDLKKIEVVPL